MTTTKRGTSSNFVVASVYQRLKHDYSLKFVLGPHVVIEPTYCIRPKPTTEITQEVKIPTISGYLEKGNKNEFEPSLI
jgi:hypothetical protein